MTIEDLQPDDDEGREDPAHCQHDEDPDDSETQHASDARSRDETTRIRLILYVWLAIPQRSIPRDRHAYSRNKIISHNRQVADVLISIGVRIMVLVRVRLG